MYVFFVIEFNFYLQNKKEEFLFFVKHDIQVLGM